MKAFTLSACLLISVVAFATEINKSIPVQKGQRLRIWFDYPKLVKVTSWDKNEIQVTGQVSINDGENDEAFELDVKTSDNTISIKNRIVGFDRLPHRVTVTQGGTKLVFKSEKEWRKYSEEHGRSENVSMGVDIEIVLEIKVPKNMETAVESVYGLVEVRDFIGPIDVQATYGGVDASLAVTTIGELIAETNYGNIYSNLDIQVDKRNAREEDFHTLVRAFPGSGPRCKFESPYGNVYLRRVK